MAIVLQGDPVSKGISIGKCYIIEKGQPIIKKKLACGATSPLLT